MRLRLVVICVPVFVAVMLTTVPVALAPQNNGQANASTENALVLQRKGWAPQAIHSSKSSRVFRGVVHRLAQSIDMARKIAVVDGKEVPIIVDEDQMPVEQGYVDENGDGFLDLIRKEADGVSWLYLNQGTVSNPLYRSGRRLTQAEMACISRYIVYTSPDDSTIKAVTIQPTAWVFLSYARFDVYIDSTYYAHNTPQIDQFFDLFEPRYALLESTTGWSSEEYYGTKLKINVTATPGCWTGRAYAGNAFLSFSTPLYDPGCAIPYYENGIPYFGNPGELGDYWTYMGIAIHEGLHSITPPSILTRRWFTEGFSSYYEHNLLSHYNGNGFPKDINQETADTYIYEGGGQYNWIGYVANDYHDNTPQNNPIQSSAGYDISAWLFSMMRDNHSLNWNSLYSIINSNRETVDKAWALAAVDVYDADMFNIDLFGRASGLTFPQTQAIWRYDGPSGPGWGVRNWEPLDWYADLSPGIEIAGCNGDSVALEATVRNSGDVSLHTVKLGIYVGENVQWEDTIAVAAHDSVVVTLVLPSAAFPAQVSAKVNTDSTKIESNYDNNTATVYVSESSVPAVPGQPSVLPSRPVCVSRQYTIRWDPVPSAEYYQIRENGGEWSSCGAATMWGFAKLGGGTYTYEVRALNACGASSPSPLATVVVVPCFDIVVYSLHPGAGVPISVSPQDQNGEGNGSSPLARVYAQSTLLTLQAPASVNGWSFLKWQRDGVDYSTNPILIDQVDTSRILTAVYQAPILSIGSVNPSAGVPIAVLPPDVNEQTDGSTPFARVYEIGTGVTLQAPAKANGNPFEKWQRNGADYTGNQTAALAMDTLYDMTAVYRSIAAVEVESKSVSAGIVPIHIKLSNDVPVRKVVLPLEIREVTTGATISTMRVIYAERLTNYLTGLSTALQFANPDGTCKNGLAGGYRNATSVITPNVDVAIGPLPEGISLVRGKVADPALPAGADTSGSIILSLDLTGVHGTFEIDTTCTNPANHCMFTQEDPPVYTNIVPTFTKGTITVSCDCPRQGDINGDAVIDVFDVIGVIGIAFSGDADPREPGCSTTRADVNYDGVADVFDVIYLIATAFSGGANPVDPCGP